MTEPEGKPDLAAVREGARVVASDGYAGTVREVLIGDAVAESYLHVRTGGLLGKDRYVAAYDVQRVTPETVWLKITRRAVVETTGRTRPSAFVHGGAGPIA
ncbi:MAG TPA: hypothetical protein VGM69_15115 [Chloroflexota bacterium]